MNSYWIKSGILTLLERFSVLFFGFGSFYILVRVLDKEDFGVWAIYISVTSVLEALRNSFIFNTLIKFYTIVKNKAYLLNTAFALLFFLTILFSIGFISLSNIFNMLWDSSTIGPMFKWYMIVFLVTGIVSIFNSFEQAKLNFFSSFISTFIFRAGFFVYLIICFILDFNVIVYELVFVQISASFLSLIFGLYFFRKHLILSKSIDLKLIIRFFNYGKYVVGSSIGSILSKTINQMMLGSMISPVASGTYNVSARIINLIEVPIHSIAKVVFPKSVERIDEIGVSSTKYLYEKSVGSSIAIIAPIILITYTLAHFVVEFIAGNEYHETIPILRVSLFSALLLPFHSQFGVIVNSLGYTKLSFKLVLVTTSINILANYLLIKYIGIMGAAYASLFAAIVGAILGFFVLKKIIEISFIHALKYAIKFYPELFTNIIVPKLNKIIKD